MLGDGVDKLKVKNCFLTTWIENGSGSQYIDIVSELSAKLSQHPIYCCKENVNF